MKQIAFIHLSDIHFTGSSGNSYDIDANLRNAVITDLQYNLLDNIEHVQGILLGGDIAFSGQEAEYEKAEEFIAEIEAAVKEKLEIVCCVPGNHDVDQDSIRNSISVSSAHRAIEEALTIDDADNILRCYMEDSHNAELLYESIKQYNKFAQKYGCDINSTKATWCKIFELDHHMKLKIVGLNSCIISSHEDHKSADAEERKMIIGQNQIPKYEEDTVCVSLCHHPTEYWKFWEQLNRQVDKRLDIQLYGHKHEQAIDQNDERLTLKAGATHPTRGEGWEPRYNWITFECIEKSDGRYICVKTFPRVLTEDRDSFIADQEKCEKGKKYFVYELNVDRKRKENLCDNDNSQVLSINSKQDSLSKLSEDINVQKIIYDFLNLSNIQQSEIFFSLDMMDMIQPEKRIGLYIDQIWKNIEEKGKIDEFKTMIHQKKNRK